jgi:putative ABC transport system permease protein
MLADFRYALRGLYRSPAVASVAVLSLALGIGANTAIFSLVNAILLRTLPVRDPSRLVIFTLSSPDRFAGSAISPVLYQEIGAKNSVLEGFGAVAGAPITVAGGSSERVNGLLVSGNFFEILGVSAVIGRVLTPEDDRIPDSPAVCVLSYGLWQRSFAGDRNVIGRKVQMNGQPFTILGVTPKEFTGLNQGVQTDVYAPRMAVGMSLYVNFLETFGRLKPTVSIAQAQASLDVLYHQLETRPPRGAKLSDIKIVLQPGSQGFNRLRAQYEQPLLILMVVVALVLLIACANVTNLLMARASGRAKEIAVRLALGARRSQLVRQLLVESMLLTISGAALGMVLAYWVDHALVALAPQRISGDAPMVDVNPDWRVFLFTLGIALVVSVLSGIGPAIQSTHPDVAPALKGEAGMRIARGFSFTNALVVAQVALSLVLLIGAGLFLRSLHNLKSVDPGFDPGQLVVLTIEPGVNGYSQAQSQSFFEGLMERARHLPGVLASSPGVISPLSGDFSITGISVAGYQPQSNERPIISTNWVGPQYFKTLSTPLVAGRVFTEQDSGVNKVAIVNEKAARHFWPHESPIGKRAFIGGRDRNEYEIVGVVKDVKSESLREEARATVYLPFRQNPRPRIALHVRVVGKTAPVISALIRESHALDPNMPVFNATTMEAQLDRTIGLDRLMAALTALFGFLAVVLAAIGLYGVMAFAVSARTREIGIRMALGAGQARVLWQVMRKSAVLTIIGIALGVPGALWASRGVGSFLYGLSATDPWTYAVLAFVLAGVALSAAWIPARRAAQVDPLVALRYE